ncbi:hypothetical protein KC678_05660, partial [Candidatus Dojkabacteria bacterium]|nr:hypothetical protein [Candidatus Dojkabacteria bacterium]
PQKSFEVMLQDLGSDAYYFFKEKSRLSASEAQAWAGIFLRTVERAEKLQTDKDKASDFFKDLDDLLAKSKEEASKITQTQDEEAPLPHITALNK